MRILNQSIENTPLDTVRPHPRNPRRGSVDTIQSSIDINGFYGVIVAQKSTGYILAGNHRWLAANESGAEEIPVVWLDIEDDHALRILLADNRTNDLAEYDDDLLTELLNELAEDTGTLLGTGYDEDEIDGLIDRSIRSEHDGEIDPADHWLGMPEFHNDDLQSFQKITIHFKTPEDRDDFSGIIGQNITDKTKSLWHPRMEKEDQSNQKWVATDDPENES